MFQVFEIIRNYQHFSVEFTNFVLIVKVCVDPSEKIVSPSLPASRRVTGFETVAPESPEIVTFEFAAAVRSVSETRVTVIVLVAPATGLLCPMAFVVND